MLVAPVFRHLGATPVVTYLHRALYTAANGTALNTYTPDTGVGYTHAIGTYEIQSGTAEALSTDTPGNQAVAITTLSGAWGNASLLYHPNGSGGSGGFAFNYESGGQTFYFVQAEESTEDFVLYWFDGAAFNPLDVDDAGAIAENWYEVRVAKSGDNITAELWLVGGSMIASLNHTEGGGIQNPASLDVGLRADTAGPRFDSLLVW